MSLASPISAPPPDIAAEKLLPGEHTLPASWWTSEKVFELEKRAIFHKSWLFCIHSSRFKKPGDYFQFNVTGINFFLIMAKDGTISAFHNVCRHRAYPVVRKEQGSSIVLGCKYHGWSYNAKGDLTKAPHFENIEGFKKEENSLFPINTHVTPQGLVYVNFCNDPEQLMPFEEFFEGLTEEMDEFDFSDYDYHMSYELKGEFNWKTLMDGYQECYHCPTAHPGLNSAFKMETYKVVPKTRYCRHYAEIVREEIEVDDSNYDPDQESAWFTFGKKKDNKKDTEKKKNPGGEFNGLWIYCFPSNGINCYSPAWYSIRVLPLGPNETILQYDVYTKKGLDKAEGKEFVDFLQLVELEDFNLCVLTQRNLNQGIYNSGFLHPLKEKGVLYYQGVVRDMVKEHFALEEKNGGIINPASITGKVANASVQELDELCNKLECGSDNKNMDW